MPDNPDLLPGPDATPPAASSTLHPSRPPGDWILPRKGWLIGGVVTAALLLSAALGFRPFAPKVGRYQIAGTPGHVYIIDTATGQAWEKFAPASEGRTDPRFFERKDQ